MTTPAAAGRPDPDRLAALAAEDPEYAAALAAALAAIPAARAADTDAGDPTGPAPQPEPALVVVRRPGRRGIVLGVGIAALVVLAGCVVGRAMLADLNDAGGLTSDSTCADYRRSPAEDRVAAIRQIGLAKGVSDADHPLVMSAVDQLCETQPDARLGDVLARFDD